MDKKRILISVLLSLVFLVFVFSRVPVQEVATVITKANPFWLTIGVVVLAFTITLTGIRWDQVLRSQNFHLPFFQIIRATWYGHFFNTMFLGPAAGDILKSTIFAREQKISLMELLSASWLDRLLAGVGSIIFAIGVVIFTLANGETIQLEMPDINLLAVGGGILGFLLVCAIIWRFRLLDKIAVIRKLKDTFVMAVIKMYRAPSKTILVILLGCIGQILLSSILAWTLASVSSTSLPWIKMCWVFPVIAMLTTLPISVGGVGVREGASLLLLGMYNISKADAVAASILCLGIYWLLAAVGGLLLLVGKRSQPTTKN